MFSDELLAGLAKKFEVLGLARKGFTYEEFVFDQAGTIYRAFNFDRRYITPEPLPLLQKQRFVAARIQAAFNMQDACDDTFIKAKAISSKIQKRKTTEVTDIDPNTRGVNRGINSGSEYMESCNV